MTHDPKATPPPPFLRARGLRRGWPGAERPVLDGVDLDLAPGETVAVMGPSGSGKSTLLGILGLLDRPDAGTLTWDGEDLLALDAAAAAAVRRDRIGLVFQDHHLLAQATALDNAVLPWLADHTRPPADAVDRARALLQRMGLGQRLDHLPRALSTGQRQRVAVARALARQPRLVLADEPTGALDPTTATVLVDALLDACAGTTLVVVTHDPAVAARMGRTLSLRDGRLVG